MKELLPIGSIVWLKDAKRALMVFGVKQTNQETNVEYDYIGVMYPEGNLGIKSQFMFNHEDIEKVVFRGYEDTTRTAFIENLEKFYESAEK
ncbi:MAG: DUF4176 domain-containing protein [Lachnospiraceae bacterium]|nr:DUF4176 domain-containing protein [Lachnospiraceae bacterium]